MAKQPRILAGQTAAITGAARGIGKATAQALLRQGMKVAFATWECPVVRKEPHNSFRLQCRQDQLCVLKAKNRKSSSNRRRAAEVWRDASGLDDSRDSLRLSAFALLFAI